VVPAFVDAAMRGEPLRVHGDGRQTRDFTYVGTVARVLADAATRRVCAPTPANLAYGSRISLLDLIGKLSNLLERPLDVHHEPPRAGDVRDSQAADQRLRALFPGVEPVPLDEGLARTVAWFRSAALSI
jgi:UDP-glucose 4-epimerase